MPTQLLSVLLKLKYILEVHFERNNVEDQGKQL